jgi:catechol 2,3-dioxygenase-like lactoylglutathione lyase family enzyme
MPHPVLGVDHIFLLVADLDASAEGYRRLGFTLSPRGLHSAKKGTANYTIIFEHDYFELLGVVAATPDNQNQRDMLAQDGEGFRAIACRIKDAFAAREELAARGIGTTPVGEFSRPLPLPGGGEGIASFAVTHFAPEDTPKSFMFMCQHKTPDMVWRPELKSHANGAQGLAGVVVTADDPQALADSFARLFDAGSISPTEIGWQVTTGINSATILCLSPAAAAKCYSSAAVAATPATAFTALRISVADIEATADLLNKAGIRFFRGTKSVWVAPEFTSGVILEFIQP